MISSLKIGLMLPINNTTMEVELTAWLPAGTQCTTLRIPRCTGMLTADSIPAYKADALELAKQFRTEGIDILAYGCTAASFIAGPAAETTLTQELMEATGTPVVTTARAMVQALQDAHAEDVAVVTPYQDAVNHQIKAFLTDGGIRVRALDCLQRPAPCPCRWLHRSHMASPGPPSRCASSCPSPLARSPKPPHAQWNRRKYATPSLGPACVPSRAQRPNSPGASTTKYAPGSA